MSSSLMKTYTRLPVVFTHGKGAYLWDDKGRRYLDALAGIAVCNLGHAHEGVANAVAEQAKTLVHTSNLYSIKAQKQLADALIRLSGLSNCFFSNSGAEANEAAIKIARRFAYQQGISKPQIIVMEHSFHGRTMATLSATGNPAIKLGFDPLVEGFIHIPYNDINAIKTVAKNNNHIVAILVEPVQGEGGVNIPDDNYLNQIRQLCDENQWLMMLDEIQTGMCRTGHWFAYQHNHIKPDVMTLAKGLGNGFPIGACLAGEKAKDIFQSGSHGSTFGGNPLACRAGLAVINAMESNNMPAHVSTMADYLKQGFEKRLANLSIVTQIRIKGLMVGIELNKPCASLVALALKKGILINVTAEKTIRLLPPLIIDTPIADEIIDSVSELINLFSKGDIV